MAAEKQEKSVKTGASPDFATLGGLLLAVAGIGGGNPAFYTAPTHYSGVRREAAFEDFVPADEPAPVAVDEFLDAPDKVALQFVFVLQSLGADALLATRTLLPVVFRHFIAADVNELAGEQRDHFAENVFEKRKCHILTGAEDPAGATELRIRRQRRA